MAGPGVLVQLDRVLERLGVLVRHPLGRAGGAQQHRLGHVLSQEHHYQL